MKMATSAGGYTTEDGHPRTRLTPEAAKYHDERDKGKSQHATLGFGALSFRV